MARGVYGRARFSAAPTDEALAAHFREVTVTHHDDICGGICFECVCDTVLGDVEAALVALGGIEVVVHDITCVQWFSESLLVGGGRVVSRDGSRIMVMYGPSETRSPAWWALEGWLAFHVDAADVVHPQAVQAAGCADDLVQLFDRLWSFV